MTTDRTVHDPAADLDYSQDWTAWLTDRGSDTISAATATVTDGAATVDRVTFDDTSVTFWVSAAGLGRLDVTVHITTTGDREDDRIYPFLVAEH